jgi:hypothetical protein
MAVANKKVDTTSMPPYALALCLSKELVLAWYMLMQRRTVQLTSVHYVRSLSPAVFIRRRYDNC